MDKSISDLIDAIQLGLILIDADKKEIVEVNSKAKEILEISNLVGKSCKDYLCIDKSNECPTLNQEVSLENIEVKYKTKSGLKTILKSAKHVEIKGRDYLVESFMDITKQKYKQRLLELEKKELKGLYELIKISSQVKSIDELVEKTRNNVIPNLINQDKQSTILELDDKEYILSNKIFPTRLKSDIIINGIKRGSLSYCAKKPSNTYINISSINTYAKIIGSILEKLEEKEEKEKKQKLFEAIFNNAPISVFIEKNDKIVFTNPAFHSLLGYDTNEIMKKSVKSIISTDYMHNNKKLVIKKDGTYIPVEVTKTDLYDNMTLIRLNDISLKNKLEEQMLETKVLETMLGTAGGIAHEFAQPMTILKYYLDKLKGKLPFENKIYNSLDKIEQTLKKLSNLQNYETINYVQNKEIIDLNKSSKEK